MSLPAPQQTTVTASALSATSITLTMGAASRAQGGVGIGPTVFMAVFSYSGTATGIVNGYTDSDGDTWNIADDGTRQAKIANAGGGAAGEVWVCRSSGRATTKSVTFTLSATVDITAAMTEVDQVRSAGTFIDKVWVNINTTAGTSRIGTTPAKRDGQWSVCLTALAFKDATMTCTGVPVSWQNFTGAKNGTSNVGVGLAYKAGTEPTSLAGGNATSRYNMSVNSTPIAMFSITFFRDGIATGDGADAWLDNIEGSVTAYTTDSEHFLYTSSTSAPFGGTGGSEKSMSFARFPAIDPYIKSGATYGSTLEEYCNVDGSSGFDDGTGYENLYAYMFKTDKYGSSVDSTEFDVNSPDDHVALLYSPTTGGFQHKTLTTANVHNTSGYAWSVYDMEGDTGGLQSGTWMYIFEWSGNNPRFRLFTITYPTLGTAYTKTITETLVSADAILRSTSRTIADTMTTVDSAIRGAGKSLLDTLTSSDSIIRNTTKVFSDTIVVVENIARSSSRVLAETILTIDIVSKQAGKIIADALTMTDSYFRGAGKVLTENLTIVEFNSRIIQIIRTETITVIDRLNRSLQRLLADSLSITEAILPSRGQYRSFAETLAISDFMTKQPGKVLLDVIDHVDRFYVRINGRLTAMWSRISKSRATDWRWLQKDL